MICCCCCPWTAIISTVLEIDISDFVDKATLHMYIKFHLKVLNINLSRRHCYIESFLSCLFARDFQCFTSLRT